MSILERIGELFKTIFTVIFTVLLLILGLFISYVIFYLIGKGVDYIIGSKIVVIVNQLLGAERLAREHIPVIFGVIGVIKKACYYVTPKRK